MFFHSSSSPPSLHSTRLEAPRVLPFLGSRFCSTGLIGLTVPPGGTLHAHFQERSGDEFPGSWLAQAYCCLLLQRLVVGGLFRLLGHTWRLAWCWAECGEICDWKSVFCKTSFEIIILSYCLESTPCVLIWQIKIFQIGVVPVFSHQTVNKTETQF